MGTPQGRFADDVYCYAGTDVLVNRLGIRDQAVLQLVERDLSADRQAQILSRPCIELNGFGLDTLSRLHRHLFQDVYDWAGKVRTIDISKGGTAFEPTGNIRGKMAELKRYVRENDHFRGMADGERICALAVVHNHINSLHPFREGNGRTTRLFMQLLASRSGWTIEWDACDKKELDDACIRGRDGDLTSLALAYSRMLRPVVEHDRAPCPKVVMKKDPAPFIGERSVQRRREVSSLGRG